jgi:uncharacterized protein
LQKNDTNDKLKDMKPLYIIFVLVLLCSILFFLIFEPQYDKEVFVNILMPSGKELTLKQSETIDQITKGLSHEKTLSDYDGMIFVFNQPQTVNFWMKDMNFPLDILYLDENKVVVEIFSQVQPCQVGSPENCPKLKSQNSNIKYVIEIPSGSYSQYQIEVGKKITW